MGYDVSGWMCEGWDDAIIVWRRSLPRRFYGGSGGRDILVLVPTAMMSSSVGRPRNSLASIQNTSLVKPTRALLIDVTSTIFLYRQLYTFLRQHYHFFLEWQNNICSNISDDWILLIWMFGESELPSSSGHVMLQKGRVFHLWWN